MALSKQDLKDIFNILKPEFTNLHNGITENRVAIDRNEKAIIINREVTKSRLFT